MQTIYWKLGNQIRTLIDKPFQTESEMEKYIFENQDLLGDVSVIYRQIKTGSKEGRPDMLGTDQDGRICIIELKNQPADEDILPQALGYAIWAEANPDSIRAIWLESKLRPENIEIDWDKLDIRIILIAPSFKRTVPRMAMKMGYPIDLIQIRRFAFESNEFVSVEVVEEPQNVKVTATTGSTIYDWEFYESEHGKDATLQFRKAVEAITSFVSRKNWNLPHNINKYYTGFKLGSKVVFSVTWGGTYAWKVRAKLPKETATTFSAKTWQFQTYDEVFKEAIFKPLNPQNPDITELEGVLAEAYKRVSGSTP